ncbi:hypothetical protein [Demequina aurantiaca]|uniref:hypothetical protein n=1 Tax=Demequina aurantiaca TaxID=676200 RepID=UPI003D346E0E
MTNPRVDRKERARLLALDAPGLVSATVLERAQCLDAAHTQIVRRANRSGGLIFAASMVLCGLALLVLFLVLVGDAETPWAGLAVVFGGLALLAGGEWAGGLIERRKLLAEAARQRERLNFWRRDGTRR